jgi:hypothetical protein
MVVFCLQIARPLLTRGSSMVNRRNRARQNVSDPKQIKAW